MNEYRLRAFKDSIFLTGFMASGKSTIGKMLARYLERPFIDLDAVIEEKEQKTIKQIFEEEGESYFRMVEWKYLLELTQTFKGIVSLGGGALQSQQIVDHLKIYGLIVMINPPLNVIVERVSRNKRRPIVLDKHGKLKSKDALFAELEALYLKRKPLYEQAHIILSTTGYEEKEDHVKKLVEKLTRYV